MHYPSLAATQLESSKMEKRSHDPAPELIAYALTQSFNHASHRCGHDSSSPIAIYIWSWAAAMLRPLRTHALRTVVVAGELGQVTHQLA